MHDTANIMKTVYFVRHGESEGNVTPVFQSPRSVLSETGYAQAQQIAERLTHITHDAFISSPYTRAKQTAETISGITGNEIEYSDLFIERVKPTSIDDKTVDDAGAFAVWKSWDTSLYTPGMWVEDGENFDDISARADAALLFLENRPESSLVVVTHGFFLKALTAKVLLGPTFTAEAFAQIEQNAVIKNTGITVFRYRIRHGEANPSWCLVTFNDRSHLG